MKYKWIKAKAGRPLGRVESLDPAAGVTRNWLDWGWIEKIKADAPPPKPEPPKPLSTKTFGGPPADKSVKSAPKKK